MINSNKIIGENIKSFIESRDLRMDWVMEMAGIDRTAFYDMLKGKGKIDIHVNKINELFGIDALNFFYTSNRNDYRRVNHLDRKGNFFKSIGLEHNNINEQELKECLEVFLEFVELIDILKAMTE
ncbi:hypothetical protein BC30048_2925 [Bacillus cereus]|uniref:helix-turn-helix domain-containing protein n=1 Tax=Bacillus cereus TaxID=1396 RepID=UPI001BAB9E2F|nr:hypothetical protein [Bacillus cereus]MBR9685762.1 hypothetical protein [Bacillus cereus]MEB9966461.1 hypothetical protein [Bacillus cereus]BCD00023.1 hypothetical protein BC30048_2925 [Bacillus cereus]